MATKNKTNEHYKSARNAFDDLKIEEKAVFLIESTVAMLVQGIETVGKTVGDGLDEAFSKAKNDCEEKEEEEKEPTTKTTRKKTTRKRAPTSKSKKTTGQTKPPEDKSE